MAKVFKTTDTMFANPLNAHVMGGYEFLMQNCQSECASRSLVLGYYTFVMHYLLTNIERVKPNHFRRPIEGHNIHPDHTPCSIRRYLLNWQVFERRNGTTVCDNSKLIINADVEEVWFAGCRSDVGGGSMKNGTRNSLARIPLQWMIRQLFKLNIGIAFHRNMFAKIGMEPEMLKPSVVMNPRPPSLYQYPNLKSPSPGSSSKLHVPLPEIVANDPAMIVYSDGGKCVNDGPEDLADATSPMYDLLRLAPAWWILEVIPQMYQYQDDNDNSLVKQYTVNLGRGRHKHRQVHDGVKIHRSVKIRMEADNLKGGKYSPRA
ncbi:hypothetical protein BDR04DRAFT_1160036 [Suillus decipiens]|nr:hypothetical protein BDR04DRAFT_1160036 [Suillus decipiens]